MISPEIIKAKGFWKSVVLISLIFIVVMLLFRVLVVYELNFSNFVKTELSRENIFIFFVNILIWVVAGFFITYFNFRKKIKENNNQQ